MLLSIEKHLKLLFATLLLIEHLVVAFDTGSNIVGECNRTAELETGTIILAQPSISAGAEFIDKVMVSTLRECYAACCKSRSCNTGIYKSKPPTYCFMFNCTPAARCSYASQDGYYTITLSDSLTSTTSYSSVGVLDAFPHQVAQLGASCNEHQTCSIEHSICSNGLCACQRGWVRRGTACVPFVCQSVEFQFQCNDSVTCIAIYDRCNGIIECPDGSDESNCPTAGPQTEPNKSLKPLTVDLNSDLVNGSQSPGTPQQSPFIFNPTTNHRHQSKARAHVSHRLTDADELLTLPYTASSARYRQRSNSAQLDQRIPLHEHFTAHRREGYISPRSALTSTEGRDWYTPENEWDLGGEDQLPEFELLRRYPTPLVANSRRESSYKHESTQQYDRQLPHRKVHKPWTHRDYWAAPPIALTGVSREEVYDNPDVDYRMGSYPSANMREELVDPSIFKQPLSAAWEHSDAVHGRRGHFPPGRTHSFSEETNMVGSSHVAAAAEEEDRQTRRSEPSSTPTPNAAPVASHGDDVLSVLQHSQSEGHTAAMILAFSLGLVCCFIVLLIVEWRRRRRINGWGVMRRRPKNVSVLFAERRKTPAAATIPRRSQQQQRRSKSFRDPGGFVTADDEPDEEQKMMIQNGLVL